MPVLIDGNNLLHAAQEDTPERPPGRSTLCDLLGLWAERTGESVRVIFDGPAPTAARAQQIGHAAIEVAFSGAGVKADDVLIGLLDADSAPRRLRVVSSDREIIRAARRRQARPARSGEFWMELRRALERPPPAPRTLPKAKHQGLAPGETDDWLRAFGMLPPEDTGV